MSHDQRRFFSAFDALMATWSIRDVGFGTGGATVAGLAHPPSMAASAMAIIGFLMGLSLA